MAKTQLKKTMEGAFILTIASFIAKILSAIYRVPYQNIVGDEGFYVYQQIYPIYGLAMTLALTGLPQFVSRIIAERTDVKAQRSAMEIVYPFIFWTAILLWGGTFLFSGTIALVMGNQALQPLVRVISFAFLLVPPLSLYRGRFQGELQMIPTAISQVAEQLLRVGIILVAAFSFNYFALTIYQTGTIAMLGALLGGLAAWGILRYYEGKIHGGNLRWLRLPIYHPESRSMARRFFVEGGLISIYSGFLILFQLLDSFLVANSLEAGGLTEQSARIAKGVYDRGQPLVQLGLVIATALSSTFLPTLTKYLTVNSRQLFLKSAKMYLRLTVSIASAASVGMAALLPFINFALFKDSAGNLTLTLFVLAVFLMATVQAYQSIHQSRNQFKSALKAAGIGLLIKAFTTWQFTVWWGTAGASLSTLLGLFGTLCYFVWTEKIDVNIFWREGAFGNKLLQCLGLMIISLVLYHGIIDWGFGGIHHRLPALLVSALGAMLGGTVFIAMAIRVRLLTVREWLLVPFGKKLLQFKGGKS